MPINSVPPVPISAPRSTSPSGSTPSSRPSSPTSTVAPAASPHLRDRNHGVSAELTAAARSSHALGPVAPA